MNSLQDLNQVVPYDWATFLHDRVDKINPHADVAGMEQGGYKLVFQGQADEVRADDDGGRRTPTAAWIAGTRSVCGSGTDGTIADVLWNGPADKAGLAPGEKIMAVNGQGLLGRCAARCDS